MSTQDNFQIVKYFFAAIGRCDKQGLAALCAEDIEWIIPRASADRACRRT